MPMSVINSIFNLLRFNRKNWKAVLLCIFAATIFWIFNALNKSYSTNISFPVSFDYNQENYIPVRKLPSEVAINVTGIGWNLFRRSLGIRVTPLVIPLERPSETKKIVGSTLPALFSNQLDGYQINFVLTDTLRIALEPRSRKRVGLKVHLPSILLKKGYAITSEPEVTPDSISIEGPWRLLEELDEPVFIKPTERNIDEDFNSDVEVVFVNNELVKRDPPTVQVKFKVEKLIQVKDSVMLQLINVPHGALPAIGTLVPCAFAIPESAMETFNPRDVRAVVDLKGLQKGSRKFYPTFEGLPKYSKVLSADSVIVKF